MDKKRGQLHIEICIVLFFICITILWVGRDFYFSSNSLYLNATDVLPHYTKIEYLAECISSFKWPSWFPYWYNESTVMQYYTPLSLILLVPLELIFHNPTIALKIFIFTSLAVGGLGVWRITHKYLGTWIGIIAAVLYVGQPFFIISLLVRGVISQAPILAIAPWHLLLSIEYTFNPQKKSWIAVLILSLLMISSHAMYGFMVILSIFIILLIAGFVHQRNFGIIFMWGATAGIAAGLLGIWWVPGVLPFENPEVPYLSQESALSVTANFTWFNPWTTNIVGAYFSFSVIALSLFTLFLILRKKNNKFVHWFLYALTVFSTIFSFGNNIPFFKYIPLADSLVPGRILTETAITSSILISYMIKEIFVKIKFKTISFVFVLSIISIIIWDFHYAYNFKANYDMTDYKWVVEDLKNLQDTDSNFNKGRLGLDATIQSYYTYFTKVYDFNITNGCNIEVTPHNKFLWFQNTALANGSYDYIIRKMFDMNVRTYYLGDGQEDFYKRLKDEGFNQVGDFSKGEILYNSRPSSYFLRQKRDAVVIGKGELIFSMVFPWVAQIENKNIKAYKADDFNDFKMVFFIEPEINNIYEKKAFENLISQLAKSGKIVFIEMGRSLFLNTIFDISLIHYNGTKDTKLFREDTGKYVEDFYIPDKEEVIGLTGLDEAYYSLKQSTITKPINIIGAKYIEGNKVYFIGGPLSQLLTKFMNYTEGIKHEGYKYAERDKLIVSTLLSVFNKQQHYTELSLPAFETKNTVWDNRSCSFEYNSPTNEKVLISVTYTPRWKIKVDGKIVNSKNVDNMVLVELPKGAHKFEMKYGITMVGYLGWSVTVLSFLLFLFIMKFQKRLIGFIDSSVIGLIKYLDIKI